MANYTNERSKFGGMVGTILVHSTPGLGTANDPTTANFKDTLPAGYLRCDGSILNSKDFVALSRVLGSGDSSRFRKDNANIREPNEETGDLGQFQLPDLGSKVIIGGRGTGIYNATTVDTGVVTTNPTNRVGPQIEVISNFGNRITANFVGNAQVAASGELQFLGNPRYIVQRETSETELNIDNFQGHAHNSTQKFINYSGNHAVGQTGGKDRGQRLANSGSYNQLDFSSDWESDSIHKHNIDRPITYAHNFIYEHDNVDIDMSGVSAFVDVDISDDEKLDQLVTPFILVEYIIKF